MDQKYLPPFQEIDVAIRKTLDEIKKLHRKAEGEGDVVERQTFLKVEAAELLDRADFLIFRYEKDRWRFG